MIKGSRTRRHLIAKNVRQAPEFGVYMEKIGWQVGKEKDFQYFVRHLPILGNFIKIQKPFTLSVYPERSRGKVEGPNSQVLDKLAKKHSAFAVLVDYSPSKTLQLDISPSEEKVLEQMKKDCRYEIRKAQKNKIKILVSQYLSSEASAKEDPNILISDFIKIWVDNAHRRGFWVPFKKEIRAIYESFGSNAYLFLAYRSSSNFPLPASNISLPTSHFPISGALILISGSTASYMHAASTPEGRKLSSPYLVLWEAIKLAKKKGCKVFDFEGILDPRDKNTKKWGGFTHFKKGFGGRETEYPLAVTKYYNPIVKFLFSLFG